MRITVRLPDDLFVRAKEKAAREGTTLTALIEQGLKGVVDRSTPMPHLSSLPVSSESGRQLVDTVKYSELVEIMEEGLPIEKLR